MRKLHLMNEIIQEECEFCGRDMELIGSGPGITVWECKKEDCGKGYNEVRVEQNKKGV